LAVFFKNPDDDVCAILLLARRVCRYWNSNCGTSNGFRLFVAKEAVERIVRDSNIVMPAFFPDEPGPFKRVASLLVLSRLTPLFTLASVNSTLDKLTDINQAEEQQWLPRVCYLLTQPSFDILKVSNDQIREHALVDWKDFPSLHSKAEFLLWLEWLCDYPRELLSDEEKIIRRGRMILATSLILEAVYYQTKSSVSPLCGACDHNIPDLRLVTFDAILWQNKLDKQAGKPLPC